MTQDITRQVVRDQVAKEVHRQTAIAELEGAAERWEQQVHDGAYTLQKDLLEYLTSKAESARSQAARLKGEA